jgi:acetyl esterase/lipase/lysophospholipase L1-like esterase
MHHLLCLNRLTRLTLIAFTCVLFLPGVAEAQRGTYPPRIDGARVETYKTIGDVKLDVWIFDPENHKPTDQRAAIVFLFGGGWRSGSPAQFESHCRYLAQQGMVAMTADYRVSSRHNTLAIDCVEDAQSVVRWMRSHAERLGIDPDRIVAAGGSAGGHLAACTGVLKDVVQPDEASAVSSRPNALALFNPAVILAPVDGVDLDPEKLADLKSRTGVDPQEISPIHHVRAGLPPTIIFHGMADTTVPFATVKRYTEVAVAAGNRCELVGYPGAGHGFFNHGRGGDPGEYYRKTLHRLHGFLQSLGYLDHDPTFKVPESDNVHLRSRLDHSRLAFEKDKKGTVAFMGGSITENPGYRDLVESYLRQRFPDTEFEFVAAGISSTCSTTGAFRLERDVLSHDPDLLFVEFAVNDDQDAAHAMRACIRGMEGIVRHARLHNSEMDIVITHFINPPILESLQQGTLPTSVAAHERVAEHYGVASIGLAQEVANRIDAGTLTWDVYGGTHPKPAGYRVAGDMMIDLLESAWSEPSPVPLNGALESRPLPKPIDEKSYFGGRLVSVTEAKTDEFWVHERPAWEQIRGSIRKRFEDRRLLCSHAIGSALSLEFNGTAIGIYVLAGPDAGTVDVSIDGEPFQTVDLYHHHSRGLHYPRTVMLATELSPGSHRMTLRVGKDRNPDSIGHAVRILDFTAN